jgi:hypothetical protein
VRTEGNEAEDLIPFRRGDLGGMTGGDPVRIPGGKGMLFFGIVSRRYWCDRHCRLVNRKAGSYLKRSAMHSIRLLGTLGSKSEKMSFG